MTQLSPFNVLLDTSLSYGGSGISNSGFECFGSGSPGVAQVARRGISGVVPSGQRAIERASGKYPGIRSGFLTILHSTEFSASLIRYDRFLHV